MNTKGTWRHTESTRSSQETSPQRQHWASLVLIQSHRNPGAHFPPCIWDLKLWLSWARPENNLQACTALGLDEESVSKVLGMSQLWKVRFKPVCLPRYQERPGKAWLSQRAAGRFISMGHQLKIGSSQTRKSGEGVSGSLRVGLGSKHTFYLKPPPPPCSATPQCRPPGSKTFALDANLVHPASDGISGLVGPAVGGGGWRTGIGACGSVH